MQEIISIGIAREIAQPARVLRRDRDLLAHEVMHAEEDDRVLAAVVVQFLEIDLAVVVVAVADPAPSECGREEDQTLPTEIRVLAVELVLHALGALRVQERVDARKARGNDSLLLDPEHLCIDRDEMLGPGDRVRVAAMRVVQLRGAVVAEPAVPHRLEPAARMPYLDDGAVLGELERVEHREVVVDEDEVRLGEQLDRAQGGPLVAGRGDAEGLGELELLVETPLDHAITDAQQVAADPRTLLGGEEDPRLPVRRTVLTDVRVVRRQGVVLALPARHALLETSGIGTDPLDRAELLRRLGAPEELVHPHEQNRRVLDLGVPEGDGVPRLVRVVHEHSGHFGDARRVREGVRGSLPASLPDSRDDPPGAVGELTPAVEAGDVDADLVVTPAQMGRRRLVYALLLHEDELDGAALDLVEGGHRRRGVRHLLRDGEPDVPQRLGPGTHRPMSRTHGPIALHGRALYVTGVAGRPPHSIHCRIRNVRDAGSRPSIDLDPSLARDIEGQAEGHPDVIPDDVGHPQARCHSTKILSLSAPLTPRPPRPHRRRQHDLPTSATRPARPG